MKKRIFYDEPTWIEKSIVYYCDNYDLEDRRDLSKLTAGALKEYRQPTESGGGAPTVPILIGVFTGPCLHKALTFGNVFIGYRAEALR